MAKVAERRNARIAAPFLRSVELLPENIVAGEFPLTLPIFARSRFRIDFTQPITFFVGENGTGKSTLLEAIAVQSGFSRGGGARDHRITAPGDDTLHRALRLGWKPKVGQRRLLPR